jgi:superfamily I DNA/RNA helicase
VCWDPARTRQAGGLCPECGKPLTIGVLHRVEELADRPADHSAAGRPEVTHLIQLHEIVGEIHRVGAKSKGVESRVSSVVASLGSELDILCRVPIEEITRAGGELLGEAIARLRRGQVHRTPGYDGEYGVIRLFEPDELGDPYGGRDAATLFDVPTPKVPLPRKDGQRKVTAPKPRAPKPEAPPPPIASAASPHRPWEPMLSGMEEVGTGLLDRLDALQRVAASAPGGPMLVVAGPGTGKTRTLTHRIAYLCAELNVRPDVCLAITFTRRAAEEMRARLRALLGEAADQVTVATFHALGLSILRENGAAAGLSPGFAVADDHQRAESASGDPAAYVKALREQNLVDLDELTALPLALLRDDPELVRECRFRWQWVFVDEYQDVDETQYELLRLLVADDGNICAIGDPDQAIYSFRGADVGYFLRFAQDFVDSRVVRLTRNYRSSAPIIAAASQAIAPTSLVRGRRLEPARLDPDAPLLGLHTAETVSAEAEWVARTIDGLVGGLSHRSFDGGRVDSRATVQDGLSFADIAVLYRTDAQAAAVVEALTRGGIPVQKRSHDRLMGRRAVAAIARELRFAAATSAATTSAAVVSAATISAAGTSVGAGVAVGGAALGAAPGVGEGGEGMVERVRAAGRFLASGRPRLFEPDGGAPAVLAEADVFSAVELLLPLAARCGDDLDSFLQALATGAEVDALDARTQAVTLLTLHAAKGLEWPVVFLVGCEDGLLPLRFPGSAPTQEAVAEERRLFFVGLTRAQRRLFLSHAVRRVRHGAEYQPARTPFLDAIDAGLLERVGVAAEKPDLPRHRQLRLL